MVWKTSQFRGIGENEEIGEPQAAADGGRVSAVRSHAVTACLAGSPPRDSYFAAILTREISAPRMTTV